MGQDLKVVYQWFEVKNIFPLEANIMHVDVEVL